MCVSPRHSIAMRRRHVGGTNVLLHCGCTTVCAAVAATQCWHRAHLGEPLGLDRVVERERREDRPLPVCDWRRMNGGVRAHSRPRSVVLVTWSHWGMVGCELGRLLCCSLVPVILRSEAFIKIIAPPTPSSFTVSCDTYPKLRNHSC